MSRKRETVIEMEWLEILEKHSRGLALDIEFVVGEEKRCSFRAHKQILSEASAVFKTMFFGSLPEKGNTIHIRDLEPVAFKCLLSYIYAQKKSWKDEVEACDTFVAANKYLIFDLETVLKDYFIKISNVNNIWKMMNYFVIVDNDEFIAIFVKKISLLHKLAFHTHVLELSMEALRHILKSEVLAISENDILTLVGLWAQSQDKNRNPSLHRMVRPLMCQIRFDAISATEFTTFLHSYGDIMSQRDVSDIKRHMVRGDSLPSWCRIKARRRCNSAYKAGCMVNMLDWSYNSLQSDTFLSVYSLTQNNRSKMCLDYIELCWKYSNNIPKLFNITVSIVSTCVIQSLLKYKVKADDTDVDDDIMRVWVPVDFRSDERILRLHLTVKFTSICNVQFPGTTYCFDGVRALETDCYSCISDVIFDGFTSEGVPKDVVLKQNSTKYTANRIETQQLM